MCALGGMEIRGTPVGIHCLDATSVVESEDIQRLDERHIVTQLCVSIHPHSCVPAVARDVNWSSHSHGADRSPELEKEGVYLVSSLNRWSVDRIMDHRIG